MKYVVVANCDAFFHFYFCFWWKSIDTMKGMPLGNASPYIGILLETETIVVPELTCHFIPTQDGSTGKVGSIFGQIAACSIGS